MSEGPTPRRRWADRIAALNPEGGPDLALPRFAESSAARAAHKRDGGLRHSLQPATMLPGHQLRVLVDGAEIYGSMLEAIAAARRWIDLETYIWESDETGRRFAAALAARARDGVEVRCILDGAGSLYTDFALFDELIAAGGRVAIFHPVGPWRRQWGWSVRDHRKLLLVDGSIAFTGGANLGDEYAPREHGGSGWHDLQLRVEGPSVQGLQRLFEDAWRYTSAGAAADRGLVDRRRELPPPLHAPPPGPGPGPASAPAAVAAPAPASPAPLASPAPQVLAVPTGHPVPPSLTAPPSLTTPLPAGLAHPLAVGRRRDRRHIQRHFQYAVALARKRVWISCAYFIPNRAWRRTLRKAAIRGVDVRVLVPRANDIPPVHFASRYTYQALLDAGVRIFEYLPSMMHAKALVVDGSWAAVGSYNLDQRSLMYNWEVAVALVDPPACARLEQQFELDVEKSREIDPLLWPKRRFWHKLRERFWHFFRLLL